MAPTIRLTVPGTLRYRGIAVRVVAEAARLVSCSAQRDPDDPLAHDVRDPFDTAVVSAFMEIFNNVAIHAYSASGGGASRSPSPRTSASSRSRFEIMAIHSISMVSRHSGRPRRGIATEGDGIHIAKTMLTR